MADTTPVLSVSDITTLFESARAHGVLSFDYAGLSVKLEPGPVRKQTDHSRRGRDPQNAIDLALAMKGRPQIDG